MSPTQVPEEPMAEATTPSRRRFTMADGAVYEEVIMREWDRLSDHQREIIQAGPGDTVFVRIVKGPR
jgi:hypothetical protein